MKVERWRCGIIDTITFDYRNEKSSNSDFLGVFIDVYINGERMNETLDIDVFFDSLINEGVKPLFTCDCGTFGCGGYYVEVIHTDEAYTIKNSYKPFDNVNLDAVIKKFEYSFSWQDILSIAKQICFNLRTTKRNETESIICSGTYGIDISNRIYKYEGIIKQNEKNHWANGDNLVITSALAGTSQEAPTSKQ